MVNFEIGQMEMKVQVASLAKMYALIEKVLSNMRQNVATSESYVDDAYPGQ